MDIYGQFPEVKGNKFKIGDRVRVIADRTKYANKVITIDHIRDGILCDIIVYETFDKDERIYYGFSEDELERVG